MADDPTPDGEFSAVLADAVLIDCMAEAAGFRYDNALRIERTSIRDGDGPYPYKDAWRVSGGGLGGAPFTDLREALSDHFRSLVRLADFDDHFAGVAERLGPVLSAAGSSPTEAVMADPCRRFFAQRGERLCRICGGSAADHDPPTPGSSGGPDAS